MPITETSVAFLGPRSRLAAAIARSMASGNYRLLFCANATKQVELLQQEIKQRQSDAKIQVIESLYCCCWEADIIILTGPVKSENQIADNVQAVVAQKIIVHVDAYYAHDEEASTAAQKRAEVIQQRLPHSKVVTVNDPLSERGNKYPYYSKKTDSVQVAGRHKKALAAVIQLIELAGFNVRSTIVKDESTN